MNEHPIPATPSSVPTPPNGGMPPIQQSPKTVYSTSEQILALLCLLLGFAFVRLVLFQSPGIGVVLFAAAFLGVSIGFYKKNRITFTPKALLLLTLSGLFAVPFMLFADEVILRPLLLVWIVCTALFTNEAVGIRTGDLMQQSLRALFGIPFKSFGRGASAIGQLVKKLPAQKTLTKILIGLAVALPVTALVLVLLVSADQIFSDMIDGVQKFLSNLILKDLLLFIRDLFFGCPIFFYLFGLLDGSLHYQRPVPLPIELKKSTVLQRVSPLTLCVAATPLLLVYLAFFCAQAPYYFAAFSAYLPEGFTVSAFARRGFFELCVVSFINFAVLLALQLLSTKREDKKTPVCIRVYSTLLSVFTLLLIATAMRKMLLYIDSFGLTKLRVLTCWAMLLLAACFILIALYQLINHLPVKRWITGVCVAFIAILSFANVDGMIAKYNVTAYQNGDLATMDITHLYSLSADAVPYTIPLLQDKDPNVVDSTKQYLKAWDKKLDKCDFPEYSLSILRARHALKDAGM